MEFAALEGDSQIPLEGELCSFGGRVRYLWRERARYLGRERARYLWRESWASLEGE